MGTRFSAFERKSVLTLYLAHLAILPLSFEHEDDQDVFQCERLLHKASESARGEGQVTKKEPDLGVQLQLLCQGHPQALGCSLQLPQLLLRFHFDNLLSQNEGTGLQGVSLCPILAEVIQHTASSVLRHTSAWILAL